VALASALHAALASSSSTIQLSSAPSRRVAVIPL
jgi:hypothetical protein